MPRTRYRVRVISYDGSVVMEDLAHLTATYSTYVDQPATSAAHTSIGRATIPLFPPGGAEYKRNSADYSRLALGQRVEIYEGGGIGAALPKFTGIIDRLPMTRSTYSIEAADSISIAQNSHRFVPFTTSETADVIIKKYGIQYYKPAYASSLGGGTSGFTVVTNESSDSGTWSAATVEGVAGVRHTGVGNYGVLRTPASYPVSSDCVAFLDFSMTWTNTIAVGVGFALGTTTGRGAGPGVEVFLENGGTGAVPAVFVRVTPQGSGSTAVSPIIPVGQWVGGQATLRGQLAFVAKGTDSGGKVPHEVLLNGQQIGCVNVGTGASVTLSPSSFVGSTVSLASESNGAASVNFFSNLIVLTSAPLFKTGTIGTPLITSSPPTHQFNNATCYEIMKAAAQQEGWTIYKTPGVGWGGDTLSVY